MNTDYLKDWDIKKEQQKTEFMERLYQHSGRTDGLFTGLWANFCIREAGPICRDTYFAQLDAIKHFQELELQQKEVTIKEEFVPTLHD